MDNQYNGEENRQMVLTQSFWQLQKAIMTQVKQTAVDNDLSVPQFTILLMMQQKGQMPQKKLQARTHFPKSTLSHAIDGLVQDGILERTHVKGNRREMDLSLSERGIALFDQIMLFLVHLKINPSPCDCLLHAYVLRFHPAQGHQYHGLRCFLVNEFELAISFAASDLF